VVENSKLLANTVTEMKTAEREDVSQEIIFCGTTYVISILSKLTGHSKSIFRKAFQTAA